MASDLNKALAMRNQKLPLPPIEILRRYFRVDEHSRLERWSAKHGWRLCAKIYGNEKYFTVGIEGKRHPAHRIIWALHHGREPEGYIDHINGCPWDNRVENLREATPAQNAWNAKREFKNKTGFKNVEPRNGKFRGRLVRNYQPHYSPYFDDPELAELAAAEMSRKMYGEFSVERRAS